MDTLWIIALLAQLDGGTSVAALQQRAAREYGAKNFVVACEAYRQLTVAEPSSGAHWADLGRCLQKLERPEDARAAEIRAAQVGDDRSRLHAYFNLWKLGSRLANLDEFDHCTSLPASVSGHAPVAACPYAWSSGGTGGYDMSYGTIFCPGLEEAQTVAQNGLIGEPPNHCVGIDIEFTETDLCRPSDIGASEPCEAGACSCEGAKDPAKCKAAVARCHREHPDIDEKSHCTVVFADSQPLRVGLVCGGKPEEATEQPAMPTVTEKTSRPHRAKR